jgi:hypothetical protein
MKKLLTRGLMGVAALAVPAGVLMALPMVAASAAPSPGWHVGYLNSSGQALSMGQAAPLSGGGATFNFTNQPNTALLLNTKGGGTDLTGKTVTATVQTTGAGLVNYRGQGQPNDCGGAPSVRLYFETSNAGGFNETNYWWANAPDGSASLDALSTQKTLSLSLADPGQWSDWNGHFGNADLASAQGFQKAVKNVTGIGLSFGGGCFFENGVGTDGTGSFQLLSLTTTP